MTLLASKTAKERKDAPMARGLLDYFPDALAAVAELSRIGNEQHNPGQPLHWDRSKSTDHADCIVRHLIDRDTMDTDNVLHATKLAWRALALLQETIEQRKRIADATAAEPLSLPRTNRRVGLPNRRLDIDGTKGYDFHNPLRHRRKSVAHLSPSPYPYTYGRREDDPVA